VEEIQGRAVDCEDLPPSEMCRVPRSELAPTLREGVITEGLKWLHWMLKRVTSDPRNPSLDVSGCWRVSIMALCDLSLIDWPRTLIVMSMATELNIHLVFVREGLETEKVIFFALNRSWKPT